ATIAPGLDARQKYRVHWQIGQAVAQLHTIRLSAFGDIPVVQPGSTFIEVLTQRAMHTIRQDRLRSRFDEVLVSNKECFDSVVQPVLCHDDLHHHNVLFSQNRNGWELSGILDFDKAWASHNETDLARLTFWDNMAGNGFEQAYTSVHRLEYGYARRRLI